MLHVYQPIRLRSATILKKLVSSKVFAAGDASNAFSRIALDHISILTGKDVGVSAVISTCSLLYFCIISLKPTFQIVHSHASLFLIGRIGLNVRVLVCKSLF